MKERVLGIYLGTSKSAACVFIDDKAIMIPSAEGIISHDKTFPSYVAFTEDGTQLVGQPAKDQAVENPDNTISEIKRYMGTDYKVNIQGKEYAPQEISAMILQKIKRDAESFLGEPITKAVITVPPYFDDNQRTATRDAGTIARLKVLRLINEPTAACLAYGIDKHEEDDINILVFELSGGTLDIAILKFNGESFNVLSTSGNTALGGTDMDNVVIKYLADEFEKKHGIDLMQDEESRRRLIEVVEKARMDLSCADETEVKIPFIAMGNDGSPLHLIQKITRPKFKYLVNPIVEKCGESIDQAIQDADLVIDEIDKVVLLCETKDILVLQDYLERYLGTSVEKGIDSAECMAIGASIKGARMNNEIIGVCISDTTPSSLGIVLEGGMTKVLIEKNTAIPAKHTETFTTVVDNQTEIEFELVQGENRMAELNTRLGSFVLDGIQPAPRGVPQIEVTFEIDENGIINIIYLDKTTGNTKSITVTSTNKMTQAEIEKAIQKAKEN